jgi:hypothetical protein
LKGSKAASTQPQSHLTEEQGKALNLLVTWEGLTLEELEAHGITRSAIHQLREMGLVAKSPWTLHYQATYEGFKAAGHEDLWWKGA